uniref:Reverse transcriptase domain-containing protein n=1 Tax=Tanacetum cinerariifolium TaxID=118510 RepID=A0A6L2LHN7_TANCI|nr:hypothetical protein [Tanacetum cinerariifolium]
METVFNISNYAVENQVKFATCILYGVALTWWKSYVKTVGQDAAHIMPWRTLMKMMTAKAYTARPRNNKPYGDLSYCALNATITMMVRVLPNVTSATELVIWPVTKLALLYGRMFPEESDKIEKYVGGLSNMINGSVMSSKPKTMAYTARPGNNKPYGDLSHYALNATITMMVRVLQNVTSATELAIWSVTLKNQNYENQAGGTGARVMVHALGGGETNQDLNNMDDDINA